MKCPNRARGEKSNELKGESFVAEDGANTGGHPSGSESDFVKFGARFQTPVR